MIPFRIGYQEVRQGWDWILRLFRLRKPDVYPVVDPDPLQSKIAEKVADLKRRDAERRREKAETKAKLRGTLFWDSRRQGTYRRRAPV